MNKGSAWLIGLVIVVIVGAGAWFGAQALLVPKLEEPWAQQLRSPIAYAGVQALVNGGGDAATGTPVLYTSEEQGYSVEVPGEPTFSEQTVTPNGLTLTQKVTTWGGGSQGYAVMSTVIPEIPAAGIDKALDDSLAGAVAAMSGATLRESEKTTLAGEPAIVAVVVLPAGDTLRCAITFHNNKQFALLVSEHEDDVDENFIASFTFLD